MSKGAKDVKGLERNKKFLFMEEALCLGKVIY